MNNLILTNPNRKMEQAMERIEQFGGAALVLSDSQDVGSFNPCKSLDILEFTEKDTTSRLNPWRCPDFYIYCYNEWAKDISGLFCQAYGLPKSCWKVLENASLRSANRIGQPSKRSGIRWLCKRTSQTTDTCSLCTAWNRSWKIRSCTVCSVANRSRISPRWSSIPVCAIWRIAMILGWCK